MDQQTDDLGEAFDRLVEAVRFFLIRLIERHTAMAASAAIALFRQPEERIAKLEQRVEALENDRRRG